MQMSLRSVNIMKPKHRISILILLEYKTKKTKKGWKNIVLIHFENENQFFNIIQPCCIMLKINSIKTFQRGRIT